MPQNAAMAPLLCVTTSRPAAVVASHNAGGGAMTLVDPHTGALGASLRVAGDMSGKVAVGAHTLSLFPPHFGSSGNTTLALAYGQTSKSSDDAYAMLVSFRHAAASSAAALSLPPILHWKGRLPEANLGRAGVSVSPCGHYIVGGGHSGTLYVWAALGGRLLGTVPAHYRAVTCLTWTPCGQFLATGGADGMVHVFGLRDLVSASAASTTDNNKNAAKPIRTWPNHQLPVHAICALPSNRLATAGQDGQVLILEMASQQVVATVQLPVGLTSLTVHDGHTLYAGSAKGTIYTIRLNEYAVYQLQNQQAITVAAARRGGPPVRDVFGHEHATGGGPEKSSSAKESSSSSEDVYRTELKGHERAVTALCTVTVAGEDNDEPQRLLCSGDESGTVRLWDLESKSCLRTVRPWGSSSDSSSSSSSPITRIQVVINSQEAQQASGGGGGMFGTGTKKHQASVAGLVTPLQKFVEAAPALVPVPFVGSSNEAAFWDVANDAERNHWVQQRLRRRRIGRKRSRPTTTTDEETATAAPGPKAAADDEDKTQEQERIQELEEELAEARETIERWQTVNNKLMARLQQNG